MPVRLALYQPDIPQNTGAIIRSCACFDTPLDIIEPCGFRLDDAALKRAAMDYGRAAEVTRHTGFESFRASLRGRLVLLTTKGATPLDSFTFQQGDTLLLGRESAGVPDAVHDAADARIVIPLAAGARSLNVAATAAIVLYEAARQLR